MATKQHHRKTRPDPNVADPLSEPTLNRRIWAAYLQRGFNRSQFALAIGVKYPTVDRWDIGKSQPEIDHVMRAAEILDYTADELYYGHKRPHVTRSEPDLSREAIKALLHELRADAEQIEALGEYERSAAGQYQRFTRSYVATFVERHMLAAREGMASKDAIDAAKTAAANARANAEANALKLNAPPSAAALATLGRSLGGAAKPRKRKPAVQSVSERPRRKRA